MHSRDIRVCQFDQRILNFLRRLVVRVTDGEVEYFIIAIDLLESGTFVEHLTDKRSAGEFLFNFFRNHVVHFLNLRICYMGL